MLQIAYVYIAFTRHFVSEIPLSVDVLHKMRTCLKRNGNLYVYHKTQAYIQITHDVGNRQMTSYKYGKCRQLRHFLCQWNKIRLYTSRFASTYLAFLSYKTAKQTLCLCGQETLSCRWQHKRDSCVVIWLYLLTSGRLILQRLRHVREETLAIMIQLLITKYKSFANVFVNTHIIFGRLTDMRIF